MTDKELIEALEARARTTNLGISDGDLMRQAAARLRALTAEPDEAMVDAAKTWLGEAHNSANLRGDHKTQRIVETLYAALSASPRREGWQMVPTASCRSG